jgi:hypothetical protein
MPTCVVSIPLPRGLSCECMSGGYLDDQCRKRKERSRDESFCRLLVCKKT